MKKIEFWFPTLLCAVCSLGTLIPIVFFAQDISLLIPFLAFIPMPFYFVAIVMKKMNKEIAQLHQQIEMLKKNNADS